MPHSAHSNHPHSHKPALIDNRDLRGLRRQVSRLRRFANSKKLDDRICDIIDLKGYSLAVLLNRLPKLPVSVQKRVANRIEDFLFFHPDRGRKILARLVTAIRKGDPICRPHLLAAIADVAARSGERIAIPGDINTEALELLENGTDFVRRGKAVELLSFGECSKSIPTMLRVLQDALTSIDAVPNYLFTETVLFALKRLGGEGLLRLLINPQSRGGLERFRLDWRDRPEDEAQAILHAVQSLETEFGHLILKVVELSDFVLPFVSMIHEGLNHTEKWIRQTSVEAMSKAGKQTDDEAMLRMLGDAAPEVRLMAVHALGNMPASQTGEKLCTIAVCESETYEIRMNALYALFAQKNRTALEALIAAPALTISINARGLAALLYSREEGLKWLLQGLHEIPATHMPEVFHYILEMARQEDLSALIVVHENLKEVSQREAFVALLSRFLQTRAGPSLDAAMEALAPRERAALAVLRDGFGKIDFVH
ncbi:MAG: hypothetical protein HQM09_08865 [Candidatus Riflebacteria bacterium]|nr:hypothetical protein [Candidatus Riflebacteria bacterium]